MDLLKIFVEKKPPTLSPWALCTLSEDQFCSPSSTFHCLLNLWKTGTDLPGIPFFSTITQAWLEICSLLSLSVLLLLALFLLRCSPASSGSTFTPLLALPEKGKPSCHCSLPCAWNKMRQLPSLYLPAYCGDKSCCVHPKMRKYCRNTSCPKGLLWRTLKVLEQGTKNERKEKIISNGVKRKACDSWESTNDLSGSCSNAIQGADHIYSLH